MPSRSRPATPIARIIASGDEMTLGRTVDTNSAWLADQLGRAGLRVDRMTVVGDAQADVVQAVRSSCDGAALVVMTGGLGPTDDDRTRHALAEVMGVDLVERPGAWRAIERWYARSSRTPSPTNRRQALFPRGAAMLANDRGTAPGILARIGACRVACLPGVPHEMRAMFERIAARLPALVPGLVVPHVAELYLAGVGESDVQARIPGLMTESDPQVGITASELGHLCLRVVGRPAQTRRRIAELRARVGEWLLPEAGLAASVVGALRARRWTITAAESCTCGHVVAQLGAIAGVSDVLRASLITYHADAKRDALGVDPALIAREGVVSEAVARAMAEGARRAAGADLAVATTGVAGPGGGSADTPVGTVWVAAATSAGTSARRHQLQGMRDRIQRRAAAMALALAWQALGAVPAKPAASRAKTVR
ncbi:MAG TPA: CinA family nicotinamide mononucleotide deamidase-related protein [Planctomycetota bacterium]|nr:CinA family nicotinamide mononucleotide deamidase-related protein [Planctomycetota bacterium]